MVSIFPSRAAISSSFMHLHYYDSFIISTAAAVPFLIVFFNFVVTFVPLSLYECVRLLQAVNGLSAVVSAGVREVQTVSTRSDPGYPILQGTFTLAFNGEV